MKHQGVHIAILTVAGFLLIAPDVMAQHQHQTDPRSGFSDSAQAVNKIKETSSRYQDVNNAIASGYRLVGPDFPGMGEHWVNIRQVVQRDLDLTRPAVLTYLQIGNEKRLTGVAYTWPLQRDEEPPEFIMPDVWHTHAGSIDEETLVLNPHGMNHGAANAPSLAMIHAWVWVDNPAGMFIQDNWALPFLRLGLQVPEEVPPQAGKALFLLTGGVDYYMNLIQLAGSPSAIELKAIHKIMDATSSEMEQWRKGLYESKSISEIDIDFLAHSWMEMWTDIESRVDRKLWSAISELAF